MHITMRFRKRIALKHMKKRELVAASVSRRQCEEEKSCGCAGRHGQNLFRIWISTLLRFFHKAGRQPNWELLVERCRTTLLPRVHDSANWQSENKIHKFTQICAVLLHDLLPRISTHNKNEVQIEKYCVWRPRKNHVMKVHRFRSSLVIVYNRYTFSTKFSKFLLIVLVPINASAATSVNRGRLDNSITFMEQYSTLIRRRHYPY
jgi:hypothetical protein